MKYITHLIPATSFVLELEQNGGAIRNELIATTDNHIPGLTYWKWQVNLNYTRLLKRPLELGVFIPVHPVSGEVLLPPGSAPIYTHSEKYMKEYPELYKQAQEKVLFEGFTYLPENQQIFHNGKLFWFTELTGTVEEIARTENNIKLTPAALKEIYNT